MFPVLLDLSFFQLKSISVFIFLAVFFAAFVFWRKGREEHYDQLEIFDAFISSGIWGFIAGRIFFSAFHWSNFAGNFWHVFNMIKFPGNEPLVILFVAALCLYRRANKKKWDAFEILDFWVTAIALGMVFLYAGFFLDGSYGGSFTKMPWGLVMPGTFEKSHPAQLYFLVFYLLMFIYLVRVEYKYRTFEWYRHGRKTAQSGFLFLTFAIFTSIFYLITSPLRLPSMLIGEVVVDGWLYLALLFAGVILLLKRSGRHIFHKKEKKIVRIQ